MTHNPMTLTSVADTPNPATEVAEWVAAAQAGDQVAFTHLMKQYQRDVYGKAFSILRNHQDSDDVVQETFLRVYRALPGFRGESSFRTWLLIIATRQALDHLDRNRQYHESIEDDALSALHPALHIKGNQLASLLDYESRHLLRDALPKLPNRQKEALVLRIGRDLKYDQIAQAMDTTVGSVKAHIFHAIKNLTRQIRRGKS